MGKTSITIGHPPNPQDFHKLRLWAMLILEFLLSQVAVDGKMGNDKNVQMVM